MSNDCVLELQKIVFDKFNFKRVGFKNNNEEEVSFNISIGENKNDNLYKVSLATQIEKEDEYTLNIKLSGFFTFNGDDDKKELFLKQNAVAILMPYLRSQISLLTCQPNMEPVVLPPINIVSMLEEEDKE
nr:protein-export chaperone SecB [uncultured Tyzzerella sp.]